MHHQPASEITTEFQFCILWVTVLVAIGSATKPRGPNHPTQRYVHVTSWPGSDMLASPASAQAATPCF